MTRWIKSHPGLLLSAFVSLPLAWLILREWSAYGNLKVIAGVPYSSNPEAARGADLVYFYSPSCQLCRRSTPAVVRAARENATLRVVYFNIAAADFYEVRERLNQRFDVPEARAAEIPALFSRHRGLVGSDAILTGLPGEVRAALADRQARPSAALASSARERAKQRLSLWPVAGAAMADSVNPCAISTAMFLISYLAWAGRTPRQLALTGLLYCFGVFSCYGAAGLGLLRSLYALSGFSAVSGLLNLLAGTGTLLLGIINLRQYLLLRRKMLRPAEIGLSTPAQLATHAAVRSLITRPALFGLAAFATGAIVSAVELPCTGQIYLPTIVYLAGFPEERSTAFQYLLLYNLVFVAPLVALFVLALTATSLRHIQALVRRHLPATRLANAACFFAMAALFLLRLER